MYSSTVCTMDTFSSIAFYGILLLSYNAVHGIDTDSINQNLSTKSQNANETLLSTAERFRRLIPYVTYYVVGNNDQNDLPYQYQYQNPNSNSNTPRPSQANKFYFQNERKPQQKQQPATQHQHNYQISNQQIHQQHATSAGYLRFPSSPKIKRPIVLATTEMPYIIHPTDNSYNYYYDYSQTSPKPIVRPNPIVIKHGDHAGFLPTIPPNPNSFPEQQEQLQFTTKTKKQRRPKPKRPTTPVTTTTTTDKYGALNELLDGYDLGNRLSNKITADNIGSSIQTLSAVLQLLQNEADEQQARPLRPKKPKPEYRPDPIDEYDDTGDVGNPGRPGVDYPTLSVIPKTSFDCKTQRYKGFFGDPETLCQVWHYCDLNGGQASFLCPNGTIFNQVSLTCDWWFNVKCDTTAQLYVLNERLYKYIIPSKPSFPEDYEGPLVDRYLEDKFKETEKNRGQQRAPMPPVINVTTAEPESVRTPYQQLIDVDV
ncbi:uncharacterized protein LOC100166580 [Acyrthosiphon pisum]|uniref:Chitin-binding type-2 domain-containing protein n=1 Tax=Acyrthosiphon pisum TaxID=7029 RepID=A0A8R1W5X9_ACYPI|nr:uncharacterized protein LOC100166580 [Acyrthosiphon pisum]XP_029343662.1 uncharacterized protein LOC100166580 [Acyrthosiphon pisum]|eukprot:XP_001950804.2 PREDICTED: uncharacterized protein LOC100166580 [Acyrthosiphon pisum]